MPVSELERELTAARAEIARLHEVIAAKPLKDGKTLRVDMNLNEHGHPCLIVTAPVHFQEDKVAQEIAAVLNLWTSVANALAEDRQKAREHPSGED